MYPQIKTQEFKTRLLSQEYTLIDVRTAHEQLIYGVIDTNQTHIDIYSPDALQKIQKLPLEGKYLIYCFHGNRSQYVVQVMKELGFLEVYDLEGGIDVWKKLTC